MELLKANGLDGLADAVTVLLTSAMLAEGSEHLGAAPYERSLQRIGYANGYQDKMPKTVSVPPSCRMRSSAAPIMALAWLFRFWFI